MPKREEIVWDVGRHQPGPSALPGPGLFMIWKHQVLFLKFLCIRWKAGHASDRSTERRNRSTFSAIRVLVSESRKTFNKALRRVRVGVPRVLDFGPGPSHQFYSSNWRRGLKIEGRCKRKKSEGPKTPYYELSYIYGLGHAVTSLTQRFHHHHQRRRQQHFTMAPGAGVSSLVLPFCFLF